MKILMVCGNGLGSSFACQMTVETVLQELGVSASLDHCDLSSVKGMKADLILSGKNFESQFANLELTTPTIFLNRLVDKNEIREKIVPFLKEQYLVMEKSNTLWLVLTHVSSTVRLRLVGLTQLTQTVSSLFQTLFVMINFVQT